MKKNLLLLLVSGFISKQLNSQQCLSSGFCTSVPNMHQYPTQTFSTTWSTWTQVSAYMNADNWTLFNVTSGNTYEWTYCESAGGVSTGWDAQLTLTDNSNGNTLCFSDNGCGTNGNAPYISWTATFTGVVKVMTSQANCLNNSGAPYNKLMWRMANGQVLQQILGVDVSSYEGSINWTSVKNAGYKFAFAKATEGVSVTDSYFVTNQTNGTAAGIYMGAYHFGRMENNTASAEATHFLSVAGPYITSCKLPPVLDVEDPPSGSSLQTYFTSAQLSTWINTWCSQVQSATGIAPIIYIGPSNAAYVSSSVTQWGLWIDDYNSSSANPPPNIGVWSTWKFKQYSWTGNVPGINVGANTDMDVFNGDSASFAALLNCSTTGIFENVFANYSLYPNPAKENIVIECSSASVSDGDMISVCNLQGQLLSQHSLLPKTEIDISTFESGMYMVQIKTDRGLVVKKFIKE